MKKRDARGSAAADMGYMDDGPRTLDARPPIGFVLLIALAALVAGGKAILYDTLDPDCFWHLRVADQLQQDGIGPIVDQISFASSTKPWTPYSWLAELGMKLLWDRGGYRAAVAVQAMMQAAVVVLIAMACLEIQRQEQAGGEARFFNAAIATFIGAFFSLAYLSFRPVTAAFALLWLCTWLLLRDRRLGERSLAVWWLVPITAITTNIHLFAFLIPPAVLAMLMGAILERQVNKNPVGSSERRRRIVRYSTLLVLVSLAYLATPMLPGVIDTILFYGARDEMVRSGKISEMQFFARGPFGIATAVIAAGIAVCVVMQSRRLRVGEILWLLAGAALLFKYGRFSPVFAMAAVPALAATCPRLQDGILSKRPIVAVLTIVVVIGSARIAMSFPRGDQSLSAWLNRHGPDAPGYPCAAADFVLDHAPRNTGHIINEFGWGGYLGWRFAGHYQVLMDGRTQVFTPEFWHAVSLDGDDARRKYLATISADAAVLSKDKSPFHDNLLSMGWTSAYKDDRAEVMFPPSPTTNSTTSAPSRK